MPILLLVNGASCGEIKTGHHKYQKRIAGILIIFFTHTACDSIMGSGSKSKFRLLSIEFFGNSLRVSVKNYYSGIDLESAREALEKSAVKAG